MIQNKNKGLNKTFIVIISLIFLFNCEVEKKSCQNILECLDGTVWSPQGRESYWTIFNDPNGIYIRRFIPEIALLPNKYLFSPWESPIHILKESRIELGKTYPISIVDLKNSRDLALKAFQSLKKSDA